MELLSRITPAETLMLLKPTDSRMRDLMKFTVMDLILRQVLFVEHLQRKTVQGNRMIGYLYVFAGRNFRREKPTLHEMVFLYPYYKRPRAKIIFHHLLQMAYSHAKNEEHFKRKYLLDSAPLRELIHIGFWQQVFGSFSLSEEGKKKRDEVILYFNRLDSELPDHINQKDDMAKALIRQIKGNVLLLNSIRFELLDLIGREIAMVEGEVEA